MVRYFWSANPILLKDLARREKVLEARFTRTGMRNSQPGLRAVARSQMRPNSP